MELKKSSMTGTPIIVEGAISLFQRQSHASLAKSLLNWCQQLFFALFELVFLDCLLIPNQSFTIYIVLT